VPRASMYYVYMLVCVYACIHVMIYIMCLSLVIVTSSDESIVIKAVTIIDVDESYKRSPDPA